MYSLSSCTNEVVKEVSDRFAGYEMNRLSQYETEQIEGVYLVSNDTNKEIVQIINQNGFVEEIRLLIRIDYKNGIIKKIEVLNHNESHDYGALLTKEWFLNRFKNKRIDNNFKIVKMAAKKDNEIVAITGATKTSKAVVNGVNLAIKNYVPIRGKD